MLFDFFRVKSYLKETNSETLYLKEYDYTDKQILIYLRSIEYDYLSNFAKTKNKCED